MSSASDRKDTANWIFVSDGDPNRETGDGSNASGLMMIQSISKFIDHCVTPYVGEVSLYRGFAIAKAYDNVR